MRERGEGEKDYEWFDVGVVGDPKRSDKVLHRKENITRRAINDNIHGELSKAPGYPVREDDDT